MKKVLSAVFAVALGLTLAVPAASACPGKDKVAKEEDQSQIAKKDEAKTDKSAENQKKEPVKVTKK